MLFLENIKLALTAIGSNKMRSFLTMLGIIIGISSVIAITSIGSSAQNAVSKEFEGFGAGYMFLMMDWQLAENYISADRIFTEDDIEALNSRFPEDILYAAPYAYLPGETKIGRRNAGVTMIGVDDNYDSFVSKIQIIHGRMINERDVKSKQPCTIIDVKGAKYLFGKENAVGENLPVTIDDTPLDLTIVGVYELKPSIFTGLSMNDSYECYVPYSLLIPSGESFNYIEIYANPKKDLNRQGQSFVDYLSLIKNKEKGSYIFESAESQLGMINNVLNILSLAIGAIAAISLLVGGIGIMNIMLVSVTERTREIGIRKALGARTGDILTQFLTEAMILAGIGGIIGTLLGMGIATLGMGIVGIKMVIKPFYIILAVTFSAGVGLFFGFFPAKKAARLDPIESLRYE
ncbi:MAG: ABC transporter permease [Anaerovoracaceae bacterium]|jgi:putative ABC transport system permease protein